MKLTKKIKAIFVFAILAILSLTCAACGGEEPSSSVEFKFTKDVPTEVLYSNEIYFKDYLPREYWQDYELFVSYTDVETGEEVKDEKQANLVFTFNQVTEYSFTIKRGGDSLNCKIKGVPEVPQFLETNFRTVRLGSSAKLSEIVPDTFGVNELKNNVLAKADKSYKAEVVRIDVESAEVDGTDIENLKFDKNGSITFDQEAFYVVTFRASNSAGYDDQKVTISTADAKKHTSRLNGYVLENGEGVEDNELHFYMPDLKESLKDGEQIKVRFGKTAEGNKYDAVYDKAKDDIVVKNFPHTLGISDEQRVFFKTENGTNYSTFITGAQIVNNANKADLFSKGGGYVLITEDIDYSDLMFPNNMNIFSKGVIDGDGHTISNLTKVYSTINANGKVETKGFSLSQTFDTSTLKDIIIDNVTCFFGVVGYETIGESRIENVLVRFNSTMSSGASGARASLLGVHKEYTYWTTLKNVIVEMPYIASKESYVGMISTHCGSKQTLNNVYLVGGHGELHSTLGNAAHYPVSYYNKDNKLNVKEGVDWFASTVADDIYKNNQDPNASFALPAWLYQKTLDLGMINEITEENFADLLTATTGYYVLAEDIDFSKVDINGDGVVDANDSWTRPATVTFGGMLDGFNHKITNFVPGKADDDVLFERTNNAVIRDLYYHATSTGVRGGIIGQLNTNATTIDNCVIVIDAFGSGQGAGVVGVIQAELKLSNSIVIVKDPTAKHATIINGMIATDNSATKGAFLENVYIIDPTNTEKELSPFRGGFYETGTFGFDKSSAVEDEDYFIGTSILSFKRDNFDGQMAIWYDDLAEQFMSEDTYKEISKANVTDLMTAEAGYYVLTEDIDMKDIVWNATSTFKGTLNGNGHKLYNINTTTGLFMSTNNAVVESIELQFAETSTAGVVGTVAGETKIRNAVITADKVASASAAIAKVANAQLVIRQTLVDVKDAESDTAKYIVGSGDGVVALTDVSVVDEKAGTITEAGAFDLYDDIFDIYVAELPTAYLQEVYTANTDAAIRPHTIITKDNINTLMTATEGYFILGADIDLSKVEWTASNFNGTLNGKGFKISGISTALFNELGGMIRNVELEATNVAEGNAVLAKTIASATTLVDVAIKADETASSVIACAVNGALTLNEVFVNADNVALAENGTLLTGAGDGAITVNGAYVITPNKETALYAGTATGNTNVYSDVVAFVDANRNGDITINSDILNATDDLKVRNELNAKTLKTFMKATGGYWYMTENIDLNGAGFKSIAKFNGTLDGCGYAITNATAPIFTEFSGTLRNVAIATNKSIINKVGDALISDVVVSYASMSTPILGTVNGNVVLNEIAISCTAYGLGTKSVAYTKLASDATVTAENIYVVAVTEEISVGEAVGADGEAAVLGEDYFLYKSVEELIHADNDEDITLTDYTVLALDNAKVAVRITQENLSELLYADAGYWYLAEDVDATTIVWISQASFNGTFDGLGHKLTGLKFATTPNFNGLFQYMKGGAVKNIYLGYTDIARTHQAGIAGRMDGSDVLVENVVIDVDNYTSWGGGIITKVVPLGVNITVRNVLVNVDYMAHSAGDQYRGVLVGGDTSKAPIALDNVIVIADIEGAKLAADEKAKADAEKKGETYTGKSEIYLSTSGVTEDSIEGENYFVFKSVEEYVAGTTGDDAIEVDAFIIDGVKELNIAVAISQENILEMQSMFGGYWYLTEDIDMTDINWTAKQVYKQAYFNGVLNGNGYKIYNLKLNGHFITETQGGLVKDLTIEITELSGARAAPFGTIRSGGAQGARYENVIVKIDKITASNMYQSGFAWYNDDVKTTLKNVMVVMGDYAEGVKASTKPGLLTGYYAVNCVLDGVYVVDINEQISNIDNGTSEKNPAAAYVNAEGKPAVLGQDYFVITDILGYDKTKLPTKEMQDVFEASKSLFDYTLITAENFYTLQTAEAGYYLLDTDIDLKNVDLNGDGKVDTSDVWNQTATFKGTLNGNGHKIINYTTKAGTAAAPKGLFNTVDSASFVNLYLHVVATANYSAGLIGNVLGVVNVTNVVIDVDSLTGNSTGAIAANTDKDSTLVVTDVFVNADEVKSGRNRGALIGTAKGTIIVDNAFMLTITTLNVNPVGNGTVKGADGQAAVDGEDYLVVKAVANFDSTKLTTDFLKAGYNALYPSTEA